MYLPTLGRFTSVDRVPGGTANNYVYTLDPINSNDYSGNACYSWGCTLGGGSLGPSTNSTTRLQPAGNTVQAPAQYSQGGNLNPQTTVGGGVVQSSRSVGRRVVLAPSKPATPAAKARDNSTALMPATVQAISVTKLGAALGAGQSGPLKGQTYSTASSNVASLLPPAGYSLKGAASTILLGCAITGGAFMAAGMLAAPYTDGVSIPASTLLGCKIGAQGAMIQYIIVGDASWQQDTSAMGDVWGYLTTLIY